MQNPTPASPVPARSGGGMIVTIIVCLLGLIGAIGALYLGSKWRSDMQSFGPDALALLSSIAGKDLESLKTASMLLMITGVVGAIASIMLFWRCWTKMLALILIVCGVLPLFFHKNAMFGIPMTIAGLIALFFLRDKVKDRTAI
jgi:uncharacterized membrane protein YeaQ/YmgE (transglycosylase-associated protein family)